MKNMINLLLRNKIKKNNNKFLLTVIFLSKIYAKQEIIMMKSIIFISIINYIVIKEI